MIWCCVRVLMETSPSQSSGQGGRCAVVSADRSSHSGDWWLSSRGPWAHWGKEHENAAKRADIHLPAAPWGREREVSKDTRTNLHALYKLVVPGKWNVEIRANPKCDFSWETCIPTTCLTALPHCSNSIANGDILRLKWSQLAEAQLILKHWLGEMCRAGSGIYSLTADLLQLGLPLISHEALGHAPGQQPDSQLSV